MRWRKLGLVWAPQGDQPWACSHAMGPTPVVLEAGRIRVYVTTLDAQGRGRPIYVEVDATNPTRVLRVASAPVLDIGEPGTFDDNGLMAISFVQPRAGELWMYYAGFELCTHIRYRILTGVAISKDGGETFQRYSRAPVLDRTDQELYFRGGPFVLYEGGRFKLWYVAGSSWTEVNGKISPVYDLRYQESVDGLHWGDRGQLSMAITGEDEHGFGRPWVVRTATGYQLHYSIRRRSLGAYRLGYAESGNGIEWQRKDGEIGLDVAPDGFDSQAIMYSAVVSIGDRTFCFYNGNNFGEQGFGVAELLA